MTSCRAAALELNRASIFLACESLSAGNGGICRVARLMARVIGEEVQAGRISARALALNDSQPSRRHHAACDRHPRCTPEVCRGCNGPP